MLLPRSADCVDLFLILKARFSRPIYRLSLIGLFQLLWDRSELHVTRSLTLGHTVLPLAVDPSGWTTYIGGGLNGTPHRRD